MCQWFENYIQSHGGIITTRLPPVTSASLPSDGFAPGRTYRWLLQKSWASGSLVERTTRSRRSSAYWRMMDGRESGLPVTEISTGAVIGMLRPSLPSRRDRLRSCGGFRSIVVVAGVAPGTYSFGAKMMCCLLNRNAALGTQFAPPSCVARVSSGAGASYNRIYRGRMVAHVTANPVMDYCG